MKGDTQQYEIYRGPSLSLNILSASHFKYGAPNLGRMYSQIPGVKTREETLCRTCPPPPFRPLLPREGAQVGSPIPGGGPDGPAEPFGPSPRSPLPRLQER